MKTYLSKFAIIIICIISLNISGNSQPPYDIRAYGYLDIIDPNYSTLANYNVYAWLEVLSVGSIPYPSNPFLSGVDKGYHDSGSFLWWYNVDPPDPEPMYPFRIMLVAIRISPYAVSKAGYSDWGGYEDLDDPWSPDPIDLVFE